MLKPDDPLFLDFRSEAQAALLRIVHDFEAQGLNPAQAIELATIECGRLLNSQLIGRLPDFDEHGGLPAAHRCSIEEFFRRFGSSSARRRELAAAFSEIVRLGRSVSARLVVGGSFVTTASEPNDIDAAMLVSADVIEQADVPTTDAHGLMKLAQQCQPIQLFVERDELAWWSWFRLFTQTRDPVHLYRGVVEIEL